MTCVYCVACLCRFFFFFACFVVRDWCRSGCRQNYYLTPPSLFFFPTHNSFFNSSDSSQFEISGSLKLVSVPFSSLVLYIRVTLRKVSRRVSCKALTWDKGITIPRVCIVQYRIIFLFHLAKRINHPDPG